MNIEDVSFAKSIFDARDYLLYLQFSDSNRLHPVAGHVNFSEIINSLKAINFESFMSMQILPEPDYYNSAKLGIMHMRSLIG